MTRYMRTHKEEPMLIPSIVGAISIVTVVWVCAEYFTPESMAYAIVGVNFLLGLSMVTYIFQIRRAE